MALNNLRDFSTQALVGSLLMVLLLSFAISFMYYNNPNGLGTDTDSIFSETYANSSGLLLESSSDSDVLLNITANTNPEASDLGSRDSVATSYESQGTIREKIDAAKNLIGWVFSGATGKLLLVTLGGLVGMLLYFLGFKHIRTGD